ncbi:hypothetical protein LTR66_008339 [Elasticomyces elasticus]|nr:hypothetical protein LTR66_008339 [Elasticomyces elasticus]
MHSTIIISTFLAALAAAAPASEKRQDKIYHGISIQAQANSGMSTPPVYEPIPMEINVLNVFPVPASCSALLIQPRIAINVDPAKVECRAFKDTEGLVPGSAPFSLKSPAHLSTNLVDVNSILCYIAGSS